MEDGRISSYRISSSSFLRESPHFRPDSARLNGAYAWCSQVCLLHGKLFRGSTFETNDGDVPESKSVTTLSPE